MAVPLEDYQYWAEGSWKTRHGTYDSAARFGGKLEEEFQEVVDAYKNFINEPPQNSQEKQRLGKEFLSELGDVLWCMSALGSNGGAKINAGLQIYLYKYTVGTQVINGQKLLPPKWREEAADLSTKWERITPENIDDLLAAGFEPRISPEMNLYEDDYPEPPDIAGKFIEIAALIQAAQTETDVQYGRRNVEGEAGNMLIGQSFFEARSVVLSEICAATVLEVAYIARHELSASLLDVLQHNVQKLSSRIKDSKIDKSDGTRDKKHL